ncbi:MAG TPA: phospholipase D-like domain-containing protein [Candidatus Nitrosotalea sp.]|nr:phospholipase D-like domain-containing protein [Candidatus Nitrosotalea sp.]
MVVDDKLFFSSLSGNQCNQYLSRIQAVRKALAQPGIDTKNSNPDFGITHEKSMVIDEEVAFVKSLNWASKNLTETRDYAITTPHPHKVAGIIAFFDADWHRKQFKPVESARLIWCPTNGRDRIARFIDEATQRRAFPTTNS